jgi:hypothetical protein
MSETKLHSATGCCNIIFEFGFGYLKSGDYFYAPPALTLMKAFILPTECSYCVLYDSQNKQRADVNCVNLGTLVEMLEFTGMLHFGVHRAFRPLHGPSLH